MHKIDSRLKKVLLFDFDGVILDSLNVKTEAFYQLYRPYGAEVAEKVKSHHLLNGGVSRFEKFRKYHKDFLNIEISETELSEICKKFSNLVVEGVIDSTEVNGAWDFIENSLMKGAVCYVITGTPTSEIVDILERLKKIHLFEGIFGSPKKKVEWITDLVRDHGYSKKEMIFFGDALEDRNAAKYHDIDFYLRRHEHNTFIQGNYVEFTDFDTLDLV